MTVTFRHFSDVVSPAYVRRLYSILKTVPVLDASPEKVNYLLVFSSPLRRLLTLFFVLTHVYTNTP